MNKLFIFAIGGTGIRVVKSLTFLLASGIKAGDFEVVPIIVDPHDGSSNLKQTNRLLEDYEYIRNEIGDGQDFFNTKIRKLSSLSSENTGTTGYSFSLNDLKDQKFKDFLHFDALTDETKALVNTLFSEEHLNTKLNIGFVGNPNMGSVVLNKFRDSDDFHAFANNFATGDRVFIISSIFGGTGAAGFPMILKNIRRADESENLANKELLKNAPIGGLCVQPYFSVDVDTDSKIQRSDWIIKTKSAFHYYKKAVTKSANESINALYYLADKGSGKSYKNDPGNGGQKNPAHLIEMLGALAVLDFANTPSSRMQNVNGSPVLAFAKEYGVHYGNPVLTLKDFGPKTKEHFEKKFVKFYFAYKYISDYIAKSKDQAFMKNSPSLDVSFFNGSFYEAYLSKFLVMYKEWLDDLESNERGFKPFNTSANLPESINGFESDKSLFKRTLDVIKFNDYLNEIEKKEVIKYGDNAGRKLLDLLSKGSDKIIENYFKSIK